MSEIENSDLGRFEERCRHQWAAHVAALDPAVRERLARARQQALAEGQATVNVRPFRVPGAWLPVGAFALAAGLALAVWVSRPAPVAPPTAEAAAVEDVELLAAGEEPDFYAEEAAFYEWAGSESGAS